MNDTCWEVSAHIEFADLICDINLSRWSTDVFVSQIFHQFNKREIKVKISRLNTFRKASPDILKLCFKLRFKLILQRFLQFQMKKVGEPDSQFTLRIILCSSLLPLPLRSAARCFLRAPYK